ncbi:hypothetical protein LY76DRAFT_212483 [Colletotrichum caudatum]|nr:hypothetical protein LY76DRAFT_212483 [Colletotrichum caudatum]
MRKPLFYTLVSIFRLLLAVPARRRRRRGSMTVRNSTAARHTHSNSIRHLLAFQEGKTPLDSRFLPHSPPAQPRFPLLTLAPPYPTCRVSVRTSRYLVAFVPCQSPHLAAVLGRRMIQITGRDGIIPDRHRRRRLYYMPVLGTTPTEPNRSLFDRSRSCRNLLSLARSLWAVNDELSLSQKSLLPYKPDPMLRQVLHAATWACVNGCTRQSFLQSQNVH